MPIPAAIDPFGAALIWSISASAFANSYQYGALSFNLVQDCFHIPVANLNLGLDCLGELGKHRHESRTVERDGLLSVSICLPIRSHDARWSTGWFSTALNGSPAASATTAASTIGPPSPPELRLLSELLPPTDWAIPFSLAALSKVPLPFFAYWVTTAMLPLAA